MFCMRDMFVLRYSDCLKKVLLLLSIMVIVPSCATKDTKDEALPVLNSDIVISEKYGIDDLINEKFMQAIDFIKDDHYDFAIPLLLEVTQSTSRHSAPYINLGIAYSKVGKINEAEESLLKALSINPTHPVANNELGIVYRQMGAFEKAKEAYERVIKSYPLFIPARKNMGILCDLFMKDLNCAIEHYQAYLNIKKDDKSVKIWLQDLKRRAGTK